MRRNQIIATTLALALGATAGVLVQRVTASTDEGGARPPEAVPVQPEGAPRATLPPALDVVPAEYRVDVVPPAVTPFGAPTVGAGPLEPNPGGAPDLSPDPLAGITGEPPSVEGGPENPDLPDAEAWQAVVELSAETATAPSGGAVPAFADPCAANAAADGCGQGVSAVVLGQRRLPGVIGVWHGQVQLSSIHAPECARQLPGLDWRRDTVWAIVVNRPVTGTMHVQFFAEAAGVSGAAQAEAGTRAEARVAPSADLERAWAAAWERGASTPLVPLCLKVPFTEVAANRRICVSVGLWAPPCYSRVEMAASGTDELGFPWGAGLYTTHYSFDPTVGGDPGEAATLQRSVEIVPLDMFTVEVKVPFTSTVRGAPGEPRTAQLVTAVGYAAGVDCRTVDPASGLALDPLPVTRQVGRTRYWAPDSTDSVQREAVIILTLPTRTAPGEGVNICVYWYTFDGPSWQGPTVVNIEQHVVVPPSRAATELRFAGAGVGGGAFSLPHAQPSDRLNADRLVVSFLEIPRLNTACGFAGTGRAPVLRPLDDPGLLCRIDWATFADPPSDVLTYVQLMDPLVPGDGGVITAKAQRRMLIDNRGCPDTGCGPPRIERFNLRDGSWVDLSLTKVPLATEPLLPNGRIVATGRPDGWTVDPSGFATLAPTLRTPELPENPQLDSIGSRLLPNPADPRRAIDLVWRADRPVSLTVTLSPRYEASRDACPPRTVTVPEAGGTPTDRGTVTVTGLCPGTTYAAQVLLVADGPGGTPRVTEVVTDAGRWLALTATTAPEPVPADFDYDFTLSIDELEGSPAARGAVNAGVVFLGPATLLGLPPTSRDCGPIDRSSPVAAGSRYGDQVIGEVRVQIDLTVVLWAIGSGGAPCPAAGQVWAGTPVRIQLVDTIRWDGTTRRSFTLRTLSGTVMTLTLAPAAD